MTHIDHSQADWCNNCGFIHRSMQFSACVDNVLRQIYSYGASRNTVYVSLGSHFFKMAAKRALQSHSILHNEAQSMIIE